MAKGKSKRGRPHLPKTVVKDRDKLVFELARINCTLEEIASITEISQSTLTRNYDKQIKKGIADGKSSLKRKMFAMAMAGDTTMCIWLSKNMLGYTDKYDHAVYNPIKVEVAGFNPKKYPKPNKV